jgi:hypothetical protein
MANRDESVYRSSTLGDIPLSFTGRHLLQGLRDEVTDLIRKAYDNGKADVMRNDGLNRLSTAGTDWEPVSRARGRIAQYISNLEAKQERAKENANELFGKFGPSVREAYENSRPTDELAFGSMYAQQYGHAKRVVKNEYRVEYIAKPGPAFSGPLTFGKTVKTYLSFEGSVEVTAPTMDIALEMTVSKARELGVTTKPTDWRVTMLRENV